MNFVCKRVFLNLTFEVINCLSPSINQFFAKFKNLVIGKISAICFICKVINISEKIYKQLYLHKSSSIHLYSLLCWSIHACQVFFTRRKGQKSIVVRQILHSVNEQLKIPFLMLVYTLAIAQPKKRIRISGHSGKIVRICT